MGGASKSLLALKKRLGQVKEKNRTLEPPLNKIQADKVRLFSMGFKVMVVIVTTDDNG